MLRNIKQTLGLGRRGGCRKSRDEERNDLTNSTEESTSWEADSSSANQENLRNPKVHYGIHKSPYPEPDQSS